MKDLEFLPEHYLRARTKLRQRFVRLWLLIVLANYANTDCQCWPSQETLAEDTELSERTIITALKELEVGGLIQREQRRDKGGHRLSDLITLLFLPARDAGRQKGLGAKSVGLAATDSEPNLQMTAGLPATVAGTYKDEPPMNHQEEPQLERASHTDVCAARIFMAAHPAHRARCGDDPGVIERELKSLAADGHNIEAITETLVAYYSHPKQVGHLAARGRAADGAQGGGARRRGRTGSVDRLRRSHLQDPYGAHSWADWHA